MAKVALIAPSYQGLYGKANIRNLRWGFVPYGLAIIGAVLKQRGHHVRIIDATCSVRSNADIESILLDERPDIVGITVTTPLVNESIRICRFVKARLPQARTVLGGPHPSALPDETALLPGVDIVVCGEGEHAMAETADGRPVAGIRGICYKTDSGIVRNPARPPIDDLDALPYPLYEQLPLKSYGVPYLEGAIGIVSSRGCPMSCVFCANKVVAPRYLARGIESVLGEIELLKRDFGVRRICFWDDAFNASMPRLTKMCEEMIRRQLAVEWSCMVIARNLPFDTLRLMRKAGCRIVHLGIESGDERILRSIGKPVDLGEARRITADAARAGIETYGYFMLGLPGETVDSLERTIALAESLPLDYAQFSLLTPLPGTKVWDMARTGTVIRNLARDWDDYRRYGRAVVELPGVGSEQLNAYYRRAYRGFYFRASYIMRRVGMAKSPGAMVRNIRMAAGLLRFIS
jgi:anaerobic magnesium-protoporphyrin IX monomethyl ester cyclase